MTQLHKLLDIMQALRDPKLGCPWDKQQDFASIAPYTVEEAYEVADAIERNDMQDLCSELGDLLFQVVYHTQMANEQGLFNFEQVVQGINEKLLDRHPHVFADQAIDDAKAQSRAWEGFKAKERKEKAEAVGETHSVLEGIALNMPALSRAQKLQTRAANVGFDWDEIAPVFAKINEEIVEIQQAIGSEEKQEKFSEELGDLLFACVNLARHLEIDAESALRVANRKFETRFEYIERRLAEQNKSPERVSLQEMDSLWEEAKQVELDK